jgi:hypothetical protein
MLKQRGRSCGRLVDKSLSAKARQPFALGLIATAWAVRVIALPSRRFESARFRGMKILTQQESPARPRSSGSPGTGDSLQWRTRSGTPV